jgi:hypothetical protein
MRFQGFVLVSVLSLLLVAVAAGQESPTASTVGYTAEYVATLETGSQGTQVVYKEFRVVSFSGNWKMRQVHSGGRIVEKFAEVDRGMFIVDEVEKKIYRVAPYNRVQRISPEQHNSRIQQLVGTERILGFDVNVFQTELEGGATLLIYSAPQLNGDVLRIVRKQPRHTFVFTATKVVVGEPRPELLSKPEYPVVDRNR